MVELVLANDGFSYIRLRTGLYLSANIQVATILTSVKNTPMTKLILSKMI